MTPAEATKQLALTRQWILRFEAKLTELDVGQRPSGVSPFALAMELEGVKSQLMSLYEDRTRLELIESGMPVEG